MGYTWQQCADTLMISRTTLWQRAQELGIATQHTTSASINDEQLDAVVRMIYLQSPNNGIVMVWGQLRSLNIFVPRRRVRESLLRVCQIAVQNRSSYTVSRRVYHVPSSNAL